MRWWWCRQWWWDDNEKFEAAMPFVIIRGNINGQIRHGISCSALPSKKGNLSNLSSSLLPSSLLLIIITNLVIWSWWWWRPRWWVPSMTSMLVTMSKGGPKGVRVMAAAGWVGGCEYSYLQLTNPFVLCPRKHSQRWQKLPTHLARPRNSLI